MANDVINIQIDEVYEEVTVIVEENTDEICVVVEELVETVTVIVEEMGIKGDDGLGAGEAQQIRDDLDALEIRVTQLEDDNLVPFFELPELP